MWNGYSLHRGSADRNVCLAIWFSLLECDGAARIKACQEQQRLRSARDEAERQLAALLEDDAGQDERTRRLDGEDSTGRG